MSMDEFIEDAIRTEVPTAVVQTNKRIFGDLQQSLVAMADCLDLMKKNIYYGKEINSDRFIKNLMAVELKTGRLAAMLRNQPDMVNTSAEYAINPRELHAVLGMTTEAVELLEMIDLDTERLDHDDCALEMGDYMWYFAILASAKEIDVETEVMAAVIAKLRERYPDKFESALAISRDKDKENAAAKKVSSKKRATKKKNGKSSKK